MTDAQLYYEEFHTPANIRKHCERVAHVSVFIGRKLNERGIKVDIEKLKLAALLHDVVRIVDFRVWPPEKLYKNASAEDINMWESLREKYTGMHHADVMAEILREREESVLARIIEKHKFKTILEPNGFETWEEKILYYADKRVAHEEIVDLKNRLLDGKKRNAPHEKETHLEKVLELEKKICLAAGISPDEIK